MSGDVADRTVVEWMAGLRASGVQRDKTVVELRDLLVRVARLECARRRGLLRVRGPELEDIAQQAANDALVSIMAKLDEFRGESRFTTWAFKFVMFQVSTKIGRHVWRTGSAIVGEPLDAERIADRLATAPDQRAEQRELLGALARAVEQDLTEHQRKVFVAALSGRRRASTQLPRLPPGLRGPAGGGHCISLERLRLNPRACRPVRPWRHSTPRSGRARRRGAPRAQSIGSWACWDGGQGHPVSGWKSVSGRSTRQLLVR